MTTSATPLEYELYFDTRNQRVIDPHSTLIISYSSKYRPALSKQSLATRLDMMLISTQYDHLLYSLLSRMNEGKYLSFYNRAIAAFESHSLSLIQSKFLFHLRIVNRFEQNSDSEFRAYVEEFTPLAIRSPLYEQGIVPWVRGATRKVLAGIDSYREVQISHPSRPVRLPTACFAADGYEEYLEEITEPAVLIPAQVAVATVVLVAPLQLCTAQLNEIELGNQEMVLNKHADREPFQLPELETLAPMGCDVLVARPLTDSTLIEARIPDDWRHVWEDITSAQLRSLVLLFFVVFVSYKVYDRGKTR